METIRELINQYFFSFEYDYDSYKKHRIVMHVYNAVNICKYEHSLKEIWQAVNSYFKREVYSYSIFDTLGNILNPNK